MVFGYCIRNYEKMVFLWAFLIFIFFWPLLDPFFTLFWPLVIFRVKFLYIVICAYINCVKMHKIELINGISMSIFKFYNFFYQFWTLFWPFFYPFLTLGYIWGQIIIDFHMLIYNFWKHAKNCTRKWYFHGYFKFIPFFDKFWMLFGPLVIFGVKFL